jgi:hypothetical protein
MLLWKVVKSLGLEQKNKPHGSLKLRRLFCFQVVRDGLQSSETFYFASFRMMGKRREKEGRLK